MDNLLLRSFEYKNVVCITPRVTLGRDKNDAHKAILEKKDAAVI
jgi:hypothetical protein